MSYSAVRVFFLGRPKPPQSVIKTILDSPLFIPAIFLTILFIARILSLFVNFTDHVATLKSKIEFCEKKLDAATSLLDVTQKHTYEKSLENIDDDYDDDDDDDERMVL